MELGIALYSLRRAIQSGAIRTVDVPAVCADKLGLRRIDPTYPLLPIAHAPVRRQFKANADAAGVVITTVAVAGEGDLSASDPALRKQAVDNHRKWFDYAAEFGAAAFRADTGGEGLQHDPDAIKRCTESFATLAEWARQTGIEVMIENHGGISGNPDAVVQIIQQLGEHVRTVPDFGNFPDEIRYDGLRKMMPYAIAVHAKVHGFEPDGTHPRYDLARCIEIIRSAGYTGGVSIEFEGPTGGQDEPANELEGVLIARDALRKLGV